MPRKHLKRSRIVLIFLGIVGLVGMAIWALAKKSGAVTASTLGTSTNQQTTIEDVLSQYLPNSTVQMWVAVSAFETDGWTSQVYKDSYNLFSLIVPGLPHLSYGEQQTVFKSDNDAAEALQKYVLAPFHYPTSFVTVRSLTDFMKSKGYYTSDKDIYYAGVAEWYNKLYTE